jgi:hypothetical protein
MTEEEHVEQIENVESAIELPADVPHCFSNVVRVTSNINGVSILFGEVYPAGVMGTENEGRATCLVQMSPANAKSLLLIMKKQLANYEEEWGEIPVHPSLIEEYGDEL